MGPQPREHDGLRYEPIIQLGSSKIAGAQVLAPAGSDGAGETSHRLAPPGRGAPAIPPGSLVLDRSCQQLSDWRTRYPGLELDVTVTMSYRQFTDPRLVWSVAWILAKTDVPGLALKLDITDVSSSLASPRNQAKLSLLRKLGVRFVVTASGTAFVGLRVLEACGVEEIKLDTSFVRRLRRSSEMSPLASGFVQVARHAGLRLSAQGIENEVDLARLRELGFERGQGPYVTGPASGPQLSELLALTERGAEKLVPVG